MSRQRGGLEEILVTFIRVDSCDSWVCLSPGVRAKTCRAFIRVHLPPLLVQSSRFRVQDGCLQKSSSCSCLCSRSCSMAGQDSNRTPLESYPRSFAFICGFKSPPVRGITNRPTAG